jgi:ankyrin repeat protein
MSGDGSLLAAIEAQDYSRTQELLFGSWQNLWLRYVNPNSKNEDGETALHRAALKGNEAISRLLITARADVGAKRSFMGEPAGESILHYAIRGQWVGAILDQKVATICKLLIEAKADPNVKDENGVSPLHSAAWAGNEVAMRELLDAKADPNAKDHRGITVLIDASEKCDRETCRLLLDFKIDPNARAQDGATALLKAAEGCNEEVLRLLLDVKANPLVQDDDGCTALHFAAIKGEVSVGRILIDAKVDPNAITKYSDTALHKAALCGNGYFCTLLLEAKATPTVRSLRDLQLLIMLKNDIMM